jgi:hypothetical protein
MESLPNHQKNVISKELEPLYNAALEQDPSLTPESFLAKRKSALEAHSTAPQEFRSVGGVMMEESTDNDELRELHENDLN